MPVTVMAPREAWTDERLDDLGERVSSLDRRMEAGFAEMRREFVAVRGEMTEEQRETNGQFAAQNRMLFQLFGGMFATMLVGFLGVIATIITQT